MCLPGKEKADHAMEILKLKREASKTGEENDKNQSPMLHESESDGLLMDETIDAAIIGSYSKQEDREQYTIKERGIVFGNTIAAQRKFGDAQRAAEIRRHDLLLWGDLRMLFDPDEKDELWMNQLDWKLLKWKLYESCGVHTLFMDGTPMEINMLVEIKVP
ncbi:hypothetical protein Tco_0199837 [Tanacetum coccineum]